MRKVLKLRCYSAPFLARVRSRISAALPPHRGISSTSPGLGHVDVEATVSNNQRPAAFESRFLQNISERGFIHQCTDYLGLDKVMASGKPITAYLGFDATAPSLHVGSLLQIMILRELQKSGHKPVILIGGGTTSIGDPSGKDESRKLLTAEQIAANCASIKEIFARFLKFGSGSTDAVIVDNALWLKDLNYLEFLREYGRHFTVNRMLTFDSVKLRLQREQPLSFLEFNYILLQSYDFLHLSRTNNVKLQIGGSDQWGNIVNGVDLVRKVDQRRVYGLTTPLITTAAGAKMGKSESGAIWLDKKLLSEYDYWQFWRNSADGDVLRFLRAFTDTTVDEISEMCHWQGSDLNKAKIILADKATALLHGEECLAAIHSTVESLFEHGNGSTDLSSLELVTIDVKGSEQVKSAEGISVVKLFVMAGLAKSNNEARRLIAAGGARVNDRRVDNDGVCKVTDFCLDGDKVKLSSGKKKHKLVVLTV